MKFVKECNGSISGSGSVSISGLGSNCSISGSGLYSISGSTISDSGYCVISVFETTVGAA